MAEAINTIKLNTDDKFGPIEDKSNGSSFNLSGLLGPFAGLLGSFGIGAFNSWKQDNDYQALEAMRQKQNMLDKTVTANNGVYKEGGGIDPKLNQSPKKNIVPYSVYTPVTADFNGELRSIPRFSTTDSFGYDPETVRSAYEILDTLGPHVKEDLVSKMFGDPDTVEENSTKNIKSPLMDLLQKRTIDKYSKVKYTGAKEGGLRVSMGEGGIVKGNTYDLTEDQVAKLINLGYKIRYEKD